MTPKQRLSLVLREIRIALEGLVALALIFVTTPFTLHAQTPNLSFAPAVTYNSKGNSAFLAPPSFGRRPNPLYAMAVLLFAMLLGMVGLCVSNRRKALMSYIPLGLLVCGSLLIASCALSGGNGTGSGGTPAGTYAVTVTGVAGTNQHTTTVMLTVQ